MLIAIYRTGHKKISPGLDVFQQRIPSGLAQCLGRGQDRELRRTQFADLILGNHVRGKMIAITERPNCPTLGFQLKIRKHRILRSLRCNDGDRRQPGFAQMLTHHMSNGCNLQPGDLLGSGTTSGPLDANRACLNELTNRGAQPLKLPNGDTRGYLEDGDEVIFRARAARDGFCSIGFGECRARIEPAPSWPKA